MLAQIDRENNGVLYIYIYICVYFLLFLCGSQNVALVTFGSNVYLILGRPSELKQLQGVSLMETLRTVVSMP